MCASFTACRLAAAAAALLGIAVAACSSAPGPTGRADVRITGSDTLVNLVQAWAEHYKEIRPSVSVQVAGGGSGVGIAGLIDGTVDIAAASREIRAAERQRAMTRAGLELHEFTVALDALALYVHNDNPLEAVSLATLAEIYGEDGRMVKWSELGIHHPSCPRDAITRVGRQNNSGTFAYFRDVVLGPTREYKMGSIDQSGSKDVVALVSRTPCAIGYSGLAFATERVKTLKIVGRTATVPVGPSEATVANGLYPLARPLYLFAGKNAPGPVHDFVLWVLGPEAQQIARDLRFVPVEFRDAARPASDGD